MARREAADTYTAHAGAMVGAGESFAPLRAGDTRLTKGGTIANHLGLVSADSYETIAHSHGGLDGGFGKVNHSETVGPPTAHASATRLGLSADSWEGLAHGHMGTDGGFGTGKSAFKEDGGAAAEHAHIAANQLSVSADEYTLRAGGQHNKDDTWGSGRGTRDHAGRAIEVANRDGVILDLNGARATAPPIEDLAPYPEDKNRAYDLYIIRYKSRGRQKTAVPYYGAKGRMSRKLIPKMIPKRHYIEPFGGSFVVGLNRPRAEGREIYADLKASMVVLMSELRDDPERLIWRLRYTPYSRRGYGEAKDRLSAWSEMLEQGIGGDDGWKRGVGADEEQVRAQSVWAYGNGWGSNVDGESGAHGRDAANRYGIAAGEAEARESSFWGNGQTGFGATTDPTKSVNSLAVYERQGAAVDQESAKGQAYAGTDNWAASVDPSIIGEVKSGTLATKHGVNPSRKQTYAGYVVPQSGVEGIEILLSHPPTKCETICDYTNEVYDLFAAARERAVDLWNAGVSAVRTVQDAVKLARRILRKPPTLTVDPLPAWQAIALTWYGAVLWRLKRAQVESKTGAEVLRSYEHPTSAVLTERAGDREYLGYCLPMAETPLYHVALRLKGVETYHADALDLIEEWRDDADAMIYLDPPYLWSTRKGKNDYQFEMSDADHSQMLDLVKDARASILISGYENPLYADALKHWYREEWEVNASSAVGKNGRGLDTGRSRRVEVAWWNYDLSEWQPTQRALF